MGGKYDMGTLTCRKCKEEVPEEEEALWDDEMDMCANCADYCRDREPDWDAMREGK